MWTVKIHRLVFSEDFKRISLQAQRRIIKTIRKKLTIDPKGYGKPLGDDLTGYWRLRIGDYRAIYKVSEKKVEVLVIKIGIRRDFEVYEKLLSRLRKLKR